MWIYEQIAGRISRDGKILTSGCYSGLEEGKNNPEFQNVAMVGPIPEGLYSLSAPVDTARHGPYAIPLTPNPENEMYGRSEFLIHGDSVENPGRASEGCIICPRFARERIWESGDHLLQVVQSLAETPTST